MEYVCKQLLVCVPVPVRIPVPVPVFEVSLVTCAILKCSTVNLVFVSMQT